MPVRRLILLARQTGQTKSKHMQPINLVEPVHQMAADALASYDPLMICN